MRPDRNRLPSAALWAALAVPVLWFGLLCGSAAAPGRSLGAWFDALTLAMEDPLHLAITPYSVKAAGLCLLLYLFCVLLFIDSQRNRRPGEEHGSAQWGKAAQLCAKYRYHASMLARLKATAALLAALPRKPCERRRRKKLTQAQQDAQEMERALRLPCDQNIPLTQNVCIGLDVRRHLHNLNVMLVGGSGAGKSRYFCKPGIMQANCSYLVCDPKGELLRDCAPLLLAKGYDVKVFNLKPGERRRTNTYNPFLYLRSDADVVQLITLLFRATTAKNARSNDPFWERAEEMLLTALMLYLYHEGAEEDKNFATVMYLLTNAQASEEDENARNPVDELFQELAQKDPDHVAVQFYAAYKLAAGKTAKSILIMATARLKHFLIDEIADMTATDEMDFASLGERKRAIFVCTPVNDKSFNYLVGMMYMQAFQQLYDRADAQHRGTLPVHVRFIMDEFANVPVSDDFEQTLATCRSYNISCNIILQNLAQLKGMFEKTWENLTGNCDTFLYLGGNEQGTHKYVSELLGKATINTRTTGQTKGSHGSFTRNFQQTGRELMTPDEVRMLDNRYALLFIRGERPVCDFKYNLLRHPALSLTADGKAKPYVPPLRLPIHPSAQALAANRGRETVHGIEFEYFFG